jgi:multidrug efflux pump subunit AcrA (membrane-fusion protein)
VPVEFVEIRAHVSGYLDKVHFEDGQFVKQGAEALAQAPVPAAAAAAAAARFRRLVYSDAPRHITGSGKRPNKTNATVGVDPANTHRSDTPRRSSRLGSRPLGIASSCPLA